MNCNNRGENGCADGLGWIVNEQWYCANHWEMKLQPVGTPASVRERAAANDTVLDRAVAAVNGWMSASGLIDAVTPLCRVDLIDRIADEFESVTSGDYKRGMTDAAEIAERVAGGKDDNGMYLFSLDPVTEIRCKAERESVGEATLEGLENDAT